MYLELDGLRGLGCLFIVLVHMPKWNEFLMNNFFMNSGLLLKLFFVLSGFMICNSYSNSIKDKKDFFRFIFLRFGRIYPVHLLFLLLYVPIQLLIEISKNQIIGDSRTPLYIAKLFPFGEFFKNLFLVHSVFSDQLLFNFPSWSISAEFFNYILFALLVLFFNKYKSFIFFVLLISSLIIRETGNASEFQSLIECSTGFFMGCLISPILKNYKIKVHVSFSVFFFSLMLLFLLFNTKKELDFLFYFISFALILSLVLSSGGIIHKILRTRFLVWLGLISYSIYMSHALIELFFNRLIKIYFKRPEVMISKKMVPQLSFFETCAAILLVFLAIFLVSYLVNRFIENPFRKKSREFALKI